MKNISKLLKSKVAEDRSIGLILVRRKTRYFTAFEFLIFWPLYVTIFPLFLSLSLYKEGEKNQPTRFASLADLIVIWKSEYLTLDTYFSPEDSKILMGPLSSFLVGIAAFILAIVDSIRRSRIFAKCVEFVKKKQ